MWFFLIFCFVLFCFVLDFVNSFGGFGTASPRVPSQRGLKLSVFFCFFFFLGGGGREAPKNLKNSLRKKTSKYEFIPVYIGEKSQ